MDLSGPTTGGPARLYAPPGPVTNEIHMTDADADADADADMDTATDADAEGEAESPRAPPPCASAPTTAARQYEALQLRRRICDYADVARRVKEALSQMDLVVRDAKELCYHASAILDPLSLLIDGLCLPSARELDELEHNLRRRILYDIYLACSYVTHAVGGAIADARVALQPCHDPGTYSRNLQRLVQEQRLLRQQHPLTQTTTDTTTTPKVQGQEPPAAAPAPAEPSSAATNPDGSTITPHRTTNNNSTTDAPTSSSTGTTSTTSTTTFPTPAALAACLRADRLRCERTCTNLRTRIIDTFSSSSSNRSSSRSRSRSRSRNGHHNHHPNNNNNNNNNATKPPPTTPKPNLPAIIQGNLQWFSYIKSRNDTRTRYIRRQRRAHHENHNDDDDDDTDENEQEKHEQREHHRRQVYVAFEDVEEAEEGGWSGSGPRARAARRRLITACWEWQGWLARGELGRVVGSGPAAVMGRLERRVLGEELVWRREGEGEGEGEV
ncbi:hypothetical protein SLS58_003166 [Diplodia intermedia]|uniref:Uncharacterized protein n=1 Tax=Diplodia intermedia TaxID=856260 RepID=A0ABR3TX40_9PEZI